MDEDHTKWELDRGRGILTKSDREYLLGETEFDSKQSEYNKRSDIRERVTDGIMDFTLIYEHLEDRDLERIFNPEYVENDNEMRRGMKSAIALFYLETWKPKYGDSSTDHIDHFSALLQSAIWDAEAKWRNVDPEDAFEEIVLNIDVLFDVLSPEPVNTEYIADKIYRHALYELTEEEYRFYVFVQQRTGSKIREGEEAAEEFLENVEQLTDEGVIGGEER